jgi:hypothetical protein
MIRSFNYLPAPAIILPKDKIDAFAAYTGMLVYPALALVLVIFAFGFEQFRIAAVNSDYTAFSAREMALSRERAALLAVKDTDTDSVIALLPEIAEIRDSGERAADSIALIGSIMPPHMWIDSIAGDASGSQTIMGGAPTLKAVSMFMNDIGTSLKRRAALASLTGAKGKGVYLKYTLTVSPGDSTS